MHGLDLEAIRRKLGTHSIFGPSSAAMWALCSGSLIPNLLADDNANEDAAYGTVGHSVGETWLNRMMVAYGSATFASLIDYYRPTDLVGTTVKVVEGSGRSFEIKIDDEMLAYVREYVSWCVELQGDHYVEQRVDISKITPIEDQSGTADHACCTWQLLIITDLKMGRGIEVYADWNYQGLIYALGFFYEWDWLYNFQTILIRIAQPRRDHWDVFEISREELLRFADWIKGRAALAWEPDAKRTAGEKQCLWCKVSEDCAANAAWLSTKDDDVFDDLDDPDPEKGVVVGPDGVIHGVEYTVKEARALNTQLETSNDASIFDKPDPYKLSTEALAKLLPHRKRFEKFFESVQIELENRAHAGEEIPGYFLAKARAGRRAWRDEKDAAKYLIKWVKPVKDEDLFPRVLISPAQAEKQLRKAGFSEAFAKELLDSLADKPEGRDTLVVNKSQRPQLEPPADLFDDLDEGDGL